VGCGRFCAFLLLVTIGLLSDLFWHRHSPDYPVGRSRLEALSVIACAFIMSMASVEGTSPVCVCHLSKVCFAKHQIGYSAELISGAFKS
jgi:hypothetical protein